MMPENGVSVAHGNDTTVKQDENVAIKPDKSGTGILAIMIDEAVPMASHGNILTNLI